MPRLPLRAALAAIVLVAWPTLVLAAQATFTRAELARWERTARSVTIRRDQWGVPHISAPTDAAVVFGEMYAQAEDNFWQLEEDYIAVLGRRSELYGDSTLAGDLSVRLFEVERRARAGYRTATPRMRAIYDALKASGIRLSSRRDSRNRSSFRRASRPGGAAPLRRPLDRETA